MFTSLPRICTCFATMTPPFQHLHLTKQHRHLMYFREQEKNVTSPLPLLTVLSKLNDCWRSAVNLFFILLGPLLVNWVSVRRSQANVCKKFHMSLQTWDHLSVLSKKCFYFPVLCVQREIHSSIWDKYLQFVLTHESILSTLPFVSL